MNFRRTSITAGLALALALASSACADFQRGEYWDEDMGADEGGTAGGTGGELSFAADIFGLLDSGCARCHAPGESAGNTDFLITNDPEASFESSLEFVNLDDPAESRLLAKTAGTGHGGGTVFDDRSPEYELILAWIEQGAPP